MPDIRLVYVSKYDSSLRDEVGEILDKSEKNNPKSGITGMLCMNRKYFLQCLEGPRTEVTRTFERILRDPRHHSCELVECREIEQHHFANWSMGFVGDTENARQIINRYVTDGEFNPYAMSAEKLTELLFALSDELDSKTAGVK